jgi:hypothetical protein
VRQTRDESKSCVLGLLAQGQLSTNTLSV